MYKRQHMSIFSKCGNSKFRTEFPVLLFWAFHRFFIARESLPNQIFSCLFIGQGVHSIAVFVRSGHRFVKKAWYFRWILQFYAVCQLQSSLFCNIIVVGIYKFFLQGGECVKNAFKRLVVAALTLVMAVSYTHLDVYKRQQQQHPSCSFRPFE